MSPSVPLDRATVRRIVDAQPFDVRRASIREMSRLVSAIEAETGLPFVRMEFGIPGLKTSPIAVEAEIAVLRRGLGSVYAPYDGVPELKDEAARFVRLFLDLDVPASCCVPTVGGMEGCFLALALANRMHADRHTVLLLQPGFPVNRHQARFLGVRTKSIDFYDHRGAKLVGAVDAALSVGDMCAVIWSSPNNPSWIALTEDELAGLGRVCDAHDVLAVEDLAYFGMDVRHDYLTAGQPPFQPTVLRHAKNTICILSCSKVFSYAGQRIAIAILHPDLAERRVPDLVERLGTPIVRHAFVHGIHYPLVASVPQSSQHGLLALLRAVNTGDRTLFEPAHEYARRAQAMKTIFLSGGFRLVYDNDLGAPLADGFYFTLAYPGFDDGADLLAELLPYGISAITLETAGSCRREGLRACVSQVGPDLMPALEERVRAFHVDHPVR